MDSSPPPPATHPTDYADQASRLAELGSLWAILAHEVNNLMTKAQGHAQLALQQRPEPSTPPLSLSQRANSDFKSSQQDPYSTIEQLLSTIKRTNHLTESIMRYADPDPKPVDIQLLCNVRNAHESALGFVSQPTTGSNAGQDSIEYLAAWNTQDALALIDPVALEQILINLYLNAEQAINRRRVDDPKAPRTILVNATRECSTWNTHHDARVRLTIQDTGNGIEADQLQSIFNLWSQGEPASSRTQRGHGLGLAVCKRLVTEAGGTIRCESTPGMGTTFTIVLPGHEAENASEKNGQSQAA